jgi:hypothetical protein
MDILDSLLDLYRFPGFEPQRRIAIDPGGPEGVVVMLHRRPQKDSAVSAVNPRSSTTTPAGGASAISPAATATSRCTSRFIDSSVMGAAA